MSNDGVIVLDDETLLLLREVFRGMVPAGELSVNNSPSCPMCNRPMTGGAPHGPWPMQWECRPCGYIEVPASGGPK